MSFRTDKTRGRHPITPKKGIKEVDLNIKEKDSNDTIKVSIKPKKHDPTSIKSGDIVAWKDPFADGVDERSWRFVVLEDKGDKVLIQPINNVSNLSIIPTQTVSKSHLINANKDSPELAKSHGD